MDGLKGVLVGILVEKLRMEISHVAMEKKTIARMSEDGRWAAMGKSWHDVTASSPRSSGPYSNGMLRAL